MKKGYVEILMIGLLAIMFAMFAYTDYEKNQLKAQLQTFTQQGQHLNHSVAVDQTNFMAYNIDGEKNLRFFLDHVQPDKNYLILTYSVDRRNELINEIFALASDYPDIIENSTFGVVRIGNEDAKLPSVKGESKDESQHILAVVFRSRTHKKAPTIKDL